MRSLFGKRKIFIATTILLGAIVAGFLFALLGRHQAREDMRPLSDPHVGFQMYVPSQMPNGFQITDKRISVRHASFYNKESSDPGKLVNVSLEMNLRTNNWVYSINERRASNKDKEEVKTTLTNYDPSSVRPTCTQRTSPKAQQYRLCHWVDYSKISVFEVRFIKGATLIDTAFPSNLDRPISFDEFDTYVDSFKRGNPDGLLMLIDAV